jgi:hypothetical protein
MRAMSMTRAMSRPITERWTSRAVVALLGLAVFFSAADAAELIMFRREGCSWCARWDREIGAIYSKTDLGRRAPLRMIDLDRDASLVRTRGPIIYTPTFVLAAHGREVGRIEGYPGDAFFWGLLERLLERAPPRPGFALGGAHQSRTEPVL